MMKIGICVPHYGRPIEVDRILEVVRRAEERGLDSVWVTDHVIVPRDLEIIYRDHMLDPLAVLPWLAGVTRRISLGTSVMILPYRSPIPVAKLLASVDVLSGGRLIFGAAIGWMEGEFAALGVPFKERVSRAEEALELIRTVWTQEYPEVQTKRYRLQGVKASPMPVQKPRPPILIGGGSQGAFRRVARFGDGWHATATNHEAFRQGQQAIKGFWNEFGREGTPRWTLRLPIFVEGVHRPAVDMGWLRGRYTIQGPISTVVDQLQGFQALGCSHVALDVAYSAFPAVLETIDILAREVKPRLPG
jgi:probable F420-dependent oxidoreductase